MLTDAQAVYRLLARRWQSRLNAQLAQQDGQDENARQQDEAAEGLSDLLDMGGARNNAIVPVQVEGRATLAGLRAMMHQLNGDANNEGQGNDDEEEASAADQDDDDMEEDSQNQDLLEFLVDDDGSDDESDDFASVAEEEEDSIENDSVVMEDVDSTIAKSHRAVDQPRTVSMSSDDL